jgi:hypothetical protein
VAIPVPLNAPDLEKYFAGREEELRSGLEEKLINVYAAQWRRMRNVLPHFPT